MQQIDAPRSHSLHWSQISASAHERIIPHATKEKGEHRRMPSQPSSPDDTPLPEDVVSQLQAHGVTTHGEVELRRQLERHAASYTLFRLPPAAMRKWKARYRIMLAANYIDCQSVAECYARALLAALAAAETPPTEPTDA